MNADFSRWGLGAVRPESLCFAAASASARPLESNGCDAAPSRAGSTFGDGTKDSTDNFTGHAPDSGAWFRFYVNVSQIDRAITVASTNGGEPPASGERPAAFVTGAERDTRLDRQNRAAVEQSPDRRFTHADLIGSMIVISEAAEECALPTRVFSNLASDCRDEPGFHVFELVCGVVKTPVPPGCARLGDWDDPDSAPAIASVDLGRFIERSAAPLCAPRSLSQANLAEATLAPTFTIARAT